MGKNPNQLGKQLADTAERLSAVRMSNIDEMGIYGLLVGALYGLSKAVELGYVDRTGTSLPVDYSGELRRVAQGLVTSDEVNDRGWLAGFYFNSALTRLAPICERLGKYAGKREDLIPSIREEVNRLKHDTNGVLCGRTVGLSDAVDAASMLVTAVSIVFIYPIKPRTPPCTTS